MASAKKTKISPAKTPQRKAKQARKKDAIFPIKLIGISMILIVLIKHSFIFLIAGMLPSIVASIVDSSNSRHLLKTVAALNFAGVAPYMAELMQQGNSASAVQSMVATPSVWLVMYIMAGMGWLLIKFTPLIVKSIMEHFSDNKVSKVEVEQQKLLEEWGPEIKSDGSSIQ